MLELAHFYGWTLTYIRTLTVRELDKARSFMRKVNESQGGGQSGNASQRHATPKGGRNR